MIDPSKTSGDMYGGRGVREYSGYATLAGFSRFDIKIADGEFCHLNLKIGGIWKLTLKMKRSREDMVSVRSKDDEYKLWSWPSVLKVHFEISTLLVRCSKSQLVRAWPLVVGGVWTETTNDD